MMRNLIATAVFSASTLTLAANQADKITMHMAYVDTPSDAFSLIDRLNVMPNMGDGGVLEGVDLSQITNMAQKVWDVIKDNKPVVDIKYSFANALPQGVTSSAVLDGFSNVQHRSVRVWGTNGFGMTVYDVTMTAVHQYGGSLEGKGRYLEMTTVIPSSVDVLWGYTVNYLVDNVTTTNVGTKENPVASLALRAKMTVDTILQHSESTSIFQFRGDSPTAMVTDLD